MATREELLAQAREIQRQKLLQRARAIQEAKLTGSLSPKDTGEEEQPTSLDAVEQLGAKGIQTLGKGLDYAGGVTRTAGAYPFVKEVTGQDVLNALKAKPLAGDEILSRAGVKQGKSLSDVIPWAYSETGDGLPLQKGGWADPTARGAEGLALEMVTDPLFLASLPVKSMANAAAKIGRPLTSSEKLLQYSTRPIGTALEERGKSIYQSGFKKVDAVADKFNKVPASEVLFNNGITGTNKSIAKQSDALINQLREQQANILSEVDKRVPAADIDKALAPLQDKISEFRASKDPVKIEAADALEDDLKTYQQLKARPAQTITTQVPSSILDAQGHPVLNPNKEIMPEVVAPTPSELSGMKSSVQNSVPQKAYQSGVQVNNPQYIQGRKALGTGLRNETERLADLAAPELGDSLRNVNSQMGSLLSVRNALDKEAMKGLNKNVITSVDPIMMSLEHGTGMLPYKKAVDLGKTTWFRTNAGRGLYNLGNYGDALLRRPSVWMDLYNKYNLQPAEEY